MNYSNNFHNTNNISNNTKLTDDEKAEEYTFNARVYIRSLKDAITCSR